MDLEGRKGSFLVYGREERDCGNGMIDHLTSRRLFKSYIKDMHILRSFLNRVSLSQMVEEYSNRPRHFARFSSSAPKASCSSSQLT